jgi:hypothetical protein
VSAPYRTSSSHTLCARGEDALGGEEADTWRSRGFAAYAPSKTPAADTGNAHAVLEADPLTAGVPVGRAEAQPVERDRPGAHRHDVAKDPADTSRGPWKRLDRRGMGHD